MKRAATLPFIAAALLLAGCATAPSGADYRPMVDLRGAQSASYEADLADCQAYARRVAGAGEGAVAGAVGGAVVIGLLSAILGGGGHGRWAAAGAVSGAVSGAAAGEGNQRAVISKCLAGRGYSVLN